MSAAMVLFAVGNQILAPPPSPPALPLPCSGPSAPRLIPGSLHRYRSALASHQRAKKSSPPFLSFVILFPSFTLFIICSLFSVPFLLHRHPTYCCFLSGNYVSVQRNEHFKKLFSSGFSRGHISSGITWNKQLCLCRSSCVQKCKEDYFREIKEKY